MNRRFSKQSLMTVQALSCFSRMEPTESKSFSMDDPSQSGRWGIQQSFSIMQRWFVITTFLKLLRKRYRLLFLKIQTIYFCTLCSEIGLQNCFQSLMKLKLHLKPLAKKKTCRFWRQFNQLSCSKGMLSIFRNWLGIKKLMVCFLSCLLTTTLKKTTFWLNSLITENLW